ncbi:hypothetical protein R84B8_00579 [Treponema sp. R8-4-B8]
MKIRNNLFLITASSLAIFYLGACGNFDGSNGQGNIIINFDNARARFTVSGEEKAEMVYTITLTKGKDTISETLKDGKTSVSISVSEGTWKIEVKAEGDRVKGKGSDTVTVTAGDTVSKNIIIKVTDVRVSNWAGLKDVFDDLKNGKLTGLENIEIIADLTATAGLTFTTIQTITLWAKDKVTITRNTNSLPLFTIEKGTLILDGTKGEITIDGDKGNSGSSSQRALINVIGDNSILIMRNGVTITNNRTANYGGGIYVKQGTFKMEGGIISNNYAASKGGGVYICDISDGGGTFIKTGGIIYGSDEQDENKKNIANNNSGNAVYESGKNYNDTLGLNDNWPRP